MTPQEIYERIISSTELYPKDYIYIIDGKSGPTGKTWLTEKLLSKGYLAIDKTNRISYNKLIDDNENSMDCNSNIKIVFITLNKLLNPLRIPNKIPGLNIKLVKVCQPDEIKSGDWVYDIEMIKRTEHKQSLNPELITEQRGFVMCEISNPHDTPGTVYLFKDCDGKVSWEYFHMNRLYKVVFEKGE